MQNIKAAKWLTSGQAAKLFEVAPRTVSFWVDNGYFPNAYRLPPGRHVNGTVKKEVGDRRIPIDDVIKFARERNVKIDMNLVSVVSALLIAGEVPQRLAEIKPLPVEGEHCGLIWAAEKIGRRNKVYQVLVNEPAYPELAKTLVDTIPLHWPRPVVIVADDIPERDVRAAAYLHEANVDYYKLFSVLLAYPREDEDDSGQDRTVAGRVEEGEVDAGLNGHCE